MMHIELKGEEGAPTAVLLKVDKVNRQESTKNQRMVWGGER